MVFSPETISPIINFFKVGNRLIIAVTLGMVFINGYLFYYIIKEAQSLELMVSLIQKFKFALSINAVSTPLIYIFIGNVALTKSIFVFSLMYYFIAYLLINYLGKKKT